MFINCPFDSDYEPLFLALIAGIVSLGCRPRCVLEIPSEYRLKNIVKILQGCGASLHDLSRVESSRPKGGGKHLPRFNMPFEAGIAYALSEMGGGHSFFILESEPYRLQKTTSDLNGIDPLIHEGTKVGILRAIKKALVDPSKPGAGPTIRDMTAVANAVSATIEVLRSGNEIRGVFDTLGFSLAFEAATAKAAELRLLP